MGSFGSSPYAFMYIARVALALVALALAGGCAPERLAAPECATLQGAPVACPDSAKCALWSAAQADGSQACWSGQ